MLGSCNSAKMSSPCSLSRFLDQCGYSIQFLGGHLVLFSSQKRGHNLLRRTFKKGIDDVAQSVAVAQLVREHVPRLTVVARARNVSHYSRLRQAGDGQIERETLDSALMSAGSVL